MKLLKHAWRSYGCRSCWLIQTMVVLLAATLLISITLLVGCGQSDRLGAEPTAQVYPAPNAAIAPATVEATSSAMYPAPNAAAAIAPGVTPDAAYPAPPTSSPTPPFPTDEGVFVDPFSGELGLVIDPNGNVVVDVLPNSAAEEGGIQKGDIITQVEGQPVGKKLRKAKELLGPKANKPVKVEFERQGKKHTITVNAKVLNFPTVAPNQPTPTSLPAAYVYL